MKKLKVLDLFSGIGGFSLGLERAGMETVAFCEFDRHCCKVLSKHWPNIEIHNDVRKLDGRAYRGSVDVVCGGFPCQDLSQAGKGAGFSGERSSLYREMLRIIGECRPRYAIFENVTGLLSGESGRWFAEFLYDLAEVGYDAVWHCIPASEIGANHHRDRIWIIAYTDSERVERSAKISNSIKQYIRESNSGIQSFGSVSSFDESPLLRVDDGLPGRLDRSKARQRIKQLGNAVIPQIPEIIGKAIIDTEMAHLGVDK